MYKKWFAQIVEERCGTVTNLAEKMCMKPERVRRVLTGKTKPLLDDVISLAKALDEPVPSIIEGFGFEGGFRYG